MYYRGLIQYIPARRIAEDVEAEEEGSQLPDPKVCSQGIGGASLHIFFVYMPMPFHAMLRFLRLCHERERKKAEFG
jgi:hypothetical protein